MGEWELGIRNWELGTCKNETVIIKTSESEIFNPMQATALRIDE